MPDAVSLVILGSMAGFTIFLGMPVVLLGASDRTKGFLNAIAIGILLFLIVDVFGHAWDDTTTAVKEAAQGSAPMSSGVTDLVLMLVGLSVGLLGLVIYEKRYMGGLSGKVDPRKLSIMIALGIGAHNLSEGLAIGQSFATGATGLAVVLVVGFAAHNATEGFGITAPFAGSNPKPAFLAKVLFVGGVPTLLGTLAGSAFFSEEAFIFFLSLAGGALVYVTMLMFNTGRRQYSNYLMMTGIFIGLCAGFITDLIVSLGGA